MSQSSDYFVNHSVTHRWPFTIYHAPIERRILREIAAASECGTTKSVATSSNLKALNLGCGLFENYPEVSRFATWDACDLDARAVAAVGERFKGLRAFQVTPIPELPANAYDLIVAKEVIEHVLEPELWLQKVLVGLKPGGRLLLSTPNYGISLLPILEYTILEVLARLRGFSRFHIHPTKFSKAKLENLLRAAAGPHAQIHVARESLGMVLLAKIVKP